MRVVSLIPSGTEIVAALGMADSLVGRSHGCDFPASVKSLPVLTEAKCVTDGSSLEIDRSVREILAQATSVYRVDVARLRALAPDVIVTQTQCEVCAVSLKDLTGFLQAELSPSVTVVDLNANSIEGVYADFEKVAAALGRPEAGRALVEQQREGFAKAEASVRERPTPRVVCVEWLAPLMSSGNWIPELVVMANAEEVLATAGAHSHIFEFAELLRLQPEFLLIIPCGFTMERTLAELRELGLPGAWGELECVKAGKAFVADGHSYFNRPGPRLLDSLQILTEILHAGGDANGANDAPPTYKNKAWQPIG